MEAICDHYCTSLTTSSVTVVLYVQGKSAQTSMKNIFQKWRGMQGWQCQKSQKLDIGITTLVTPSLHHFSMLSCWRLHYEITVLMVKKKRCRDGVTCVVFVCPLLPRTAIPISSFCGYWHCHPYIPLHFWNMFFILVHVPLLLVVCMGTCAYMYVWVHMLMIHSQCTAQQSHCLTLNSVYLIAA